MKNIFAKLIAITLFISLFSSCSLFENDDIDKPVDKHLVSYEIVKSYLPDFIKLIFDQVAGEYPELDSLKEKVDYGIFVYKITYNTTFKGEDKLASGLVCVPIGLGPFPVMSYQNGTNTLHSNAPSVNPDYELYLLLEFVASTGFVVSIPDYLGFGETDDMFHPYLHKESTVQVVLDMLRAVEELTANYLDIDLKDELYIAGYSQGGWATMQVQKAIEEKHANEFNLKASACGAGPYNLNYINEYVTDLTTYPMPYFLGYMYNSYLNLGGITNSPDEIFNEPYASKITTLYDGSKSGDEINAELTTTVADLFTVDYLANFKTDPKYSSVISMLGENSILAWETTTPTLIIHGMEDDFVPTKVSTDIYQDFLALSVPIDQVIWMPLPGLGHQTGIIPSGLASVLWFMEIEKGP
ncbi:MAG: alpha/beta fold hydrolase [Prolixibacteraceae bacterium]|jgi:pimeloyl-ACP methyl ester carboxylesterase|nr:alpha/beta fold hydrolase [Prolixibacteraceae bacterium]MBT6997181.1 alpha/beta fold hydrolase [Prolixibacteraceae bacterium]MBT7396511.1 alpha/beta fold hydrolase [Prolixibacteraceae bacterium]